MKTSRSPHQFLLLPAALLVAAAAPAQSQSALEQENQRLRAQIQTMQQSGCTAPTPETTAWRDNQLAASVTAIRLGPKGPNYRNTIVATVSIEVRNTGNEPLPLNYEKGSFSLTDSHGYTYKLQDYDEYDSVKGIPVANTNRADPRQPLMPGQASTVTFLAQRSMGGGQTPGGHFDINATFGAYRDEGQGRVRKVRTFPVAFTNIAGSTATVPLASPAAPLQEQGGKALNRLVDGLFNGRGR